MSDQRPGRPAANSDHDLALEDGGPALRVTQQEHPAGPAFQVQWGWGTPQVEGPPEDQRESADQIRARARTARREFMWGGVGIAVLLLAAGASFWVSGGDRGDVTLQALGVAFVALAAAGAAVGVYLSRGD